jgi:hypothetical protein
MTHSPQTPPEHEPALSNAERARVDEALAQLKHALSAHQSPERVTQVLTSAMQTRVTQTQRRRWQARVAQWFAPGLGLAASVGMAAWIVMLPPPLATVDPAPTMIDTWSDAPSAAPFIALGSLESIAIENKPRLIQTEVPRMWLAEFGVAVNPETANEKIHAEMLIGATGQPLAVRFTP